MRRKCWRSFYAVAALSSLCPICAMMQREKSGGMARQDAATVPMWYLDWAAVILEQIPERPLRKAGRPKTDAVERVENVGNL